MNTQFAAALALLVCLGGFLIISRDFQAGRSRFWLGGKPLDVTRASDPLLFWIFTIGRAAAVSGLATACILLLIIKR